MKKKDKKKKLCAQWRSLLMMSILASIIFLALSIRPEPHFKIYEEVCNNETFITEIGQVDTSLIVLGLEEIPSIPDNAEFSCPTNSNICRINIMGNRTRCEQVEVEEMEIEVKNKDCIMNCLNTIYFGQ